MTYKDLERELGKAFVGILGILAALWTIGVLAVVLINIPAAQQ